MKRLIVVLCSFWLVGVAAAAELRWLTSVPEAEALAKKEHKLVLLHFTGSDWCVACKILDNEVLTKPEFADYAKKNLVLVELDFPAAKKQSDDLRKANEALQAKYKVDGFPVLMLLKPDETVLWTQVGYAGGGPKAILAKMDEVKNK